VVCYFFFQAEDGIRDFHVTGVQTCALPILRFPPREPDQWGPRLPQIHFPLRGEVGVQRPPAHPFWVRCPLSGLRSIASHRRGGRSEEHTSELQSRENLVCRLLLEKKNKIKI